MSWSLMVVKGLKGLQTFHNDYQRFEEKAFPCGKRAKRKRFIYELARNARSWVGAEGFSTFFRTLAISISANGMRFFKKTWNLKWNYV